MTTTRAINNLTGSGSRHDKNATQQTTRRNRRTAPKQIPPTIKPKEVKYTNHGRNQYNPCNKARRPARNQRETRHHHTTRPPPRAQRETIPSNPTHLNRRRRSETTWTLHRTLRPRCNRKILDVQPILSRIQASPHRRRTRHPPARHHRLYRPQPSRRANQKPHHPSHQRTLTRTTSRQPPAARDLQPRQPVSISLRVPHAQILHR